MKVWTAGRGLYAAISDQYNQANNEDALAQQDPCLYSGTVGTNRYLPYKPPNIKTGIFETMILEF